MSLPPKVLAFYRKRKHQLEPKAQEEQRSKISKVNDQQGQGTSDDSQQQPSTSKASGQLRPFDKPTKVFENDSVTISIKTAVHKQEKRFSLRCVMY